MATPRKVIGIVGSYRKRAEISCPAVSRLLKNSLRAVHGCTAIFQLGAKPVGVLWIGQVDGKTRLSQVIR
ncbi:MAG: hypothetical protein FD120_1775 [Gammaproteobacteria bacterium]|nr:MAG: hypothetical protein FD120_1775 [Gammaproteobacteria bacterium]